jgi:hypothetical protein
MKNVTAMPSSVVYKNYDLHYLPNTVLKHPVAGGNVNVIKNITKELQHVNYNQELMNVEMENGRVGLLLAMKAFVQLFFNPIIGNLSSKFSYKSIIFFGTLNLLMASLCKYSKISFYNDLNIKMIYH